MKILILHVQIKLRNQTFHNLCVDMLDDSLTIVLHRDARVVEPSLVSLGLFTLW